MTDLQEKIEHKNDAINHNKHLKRINILSVTDVYKLSKVHYQADELSYAVKNLMLVRKLYGFVSKKWNADDYEIDAFTRFAAFFENGLEYSLYASGRMASILDLIKNESANEALKIMNNSLAEKCIKVISEIEKRIKNTKIKNTYNPYINRLKKHEIIKYDDHAKTLLQKKIDEYRAIKIHSHGYSEDIKFLKAYQEMSRSISDLRFGLDSSVMSKFDADALEILWDFHELLETEIENFVFFFDNLNHILEILSMPVGKKSNPRSFYKELSSIYCKTYKERTNMGHKEWRKIEKRLNSILLDTKLI